MRKIIILSFLTGLFAGELEVDGNLKLSGSIDMQNQIIKNVGEPQSLTDAINGNVLQNALRNNGPFEIEYYQVVFSYASQLDGIFSVNYRGLNQTTWATDWEGFINQKSLDGWSFNRLQLPGDFYVYELIRPIGEQ